MSNFEQLPIKKNKRKTYPSKQHLVQLNTTRISTPGMSASTTTHALAKGTQGWVHPRDSEKESFEVEDRYKDYTSVVMEYLYAHSLWAFNPILTVLQLGSWTFPLEHSDALPDKH